MKTTISIALAFALAFIAACSKVPPPKPADVDYYTCTMHPSVHAEAPGKCPICGMDLVPVMKKKETEKGRDGKTANSPGPRLADSPNPGSMAGMPGMKAGAKMKGTQTSEFVVPVERQQQIGVTYAKV